MQYKVPQNVDIEDRVVGPLSLRQFVVILVTVGIIIVLYFLIPPVLRFFFVMIATLVGAAGVGIAFGKYGDQNMEEFLMSAFRTFTNPRQRVWKKVAEPVQTMAATEKPKNPSTPKTKELLSEKRDDLNRLAELVDSGGYVAVGQKDRIIGEIDKNEFQIEATNLTDIIEKSETKSPTLDKNLASADKKAPKRDPLISEVASIKPNKEFDYPRVDVQNQPQS